MSNYAKAVDPEDDFMTLGLRKAQDEAMERADIHQKAMEDIEKVGKPDGEDKVDPPKEEKQVCLITKEGSVLLLADNGQMVPVTQAFKMICAQGALHQFMDAVIAAVMKGVR